MRRIVVIGGGITGLSAAFYAHKAFREAQIPAVVTLLEQSGRLGGKIRTMRWDGFVVEKGPDSFLARKPAILELTRDLGLEHELVPTNPQAKKTYILKSGKLHRIPPGLVLGIPTEITPFMKTGLLSPVGKLRAGLDLVLPRRNEQGDETLGAFLERRMGREVHDYIAEPLLSGIYAGDTRTLSIQATFPQFQDIERKYRSLILGTIAGKTHNRQTADQLPPVARQSVFLSYRNGLETLIERLADALEDTDVRLNAGVVSIKPNPDASGYVIQLAGGETVAADGVIVTLPLPQLESLFGCIPEVAAISAVPYASVANLVLAYDKRELNHPLDGSGFVIPRREGRFITACTWTSSKWGHTAPEGKALIRCYVGRSSDERWMVLRDEEIVERVRGDIRDLMGITAEPLFADVTRLLRSMPQYPVGHLKRVDEARRAMKERMPGVLMTGAGFRGIGLPDCIRQGKEAAEEQMSLLKEHSARPLSSVPDSCEGIR